MKTFFRMGCGPKLQASGFKSVATLARGRAPFFDLFALASKSERPEAELRALAAEHFPR